MVITTTTTMVARCPWMHLHEYTRNTEENENVRQLLPYSSSFISAYQTHNTTLAFQFQ
jgi:hypothetical protein